MTKRTKKLKRLWRLTRFEERGEDNVLVSHESLKSFARRKLKSPEKEEQGLAMEWLSMKGPVPARKAA